MVKVNLPPRCEFKSDANGNDCGRFCQKCHTLFESPEICVAHLCHPNHCSLCSKSFKTEHELKSHKLNDHDYHPSTSLDKLTTKNQSRISRKMSRASSNDSEISMLSESLPIESTDTDNNKSEAIGISFDKIETAANILGHIPRICNGTSNSSDATRHAEALETGDTPSEPSADAINNEKSAFVKSSLSVPSRTSDAPRLVESEGGEDRNTPSLASEVSSDSVNANPPELLESGGAVNYVALDAKQAGLQYEPEKEFGTVVAERKAENVFVKSFECGSASDGPVLTGDGINVSKQFPLQKQTECLGNENKSICLEGNVNDAAARIVKRVKRSAKTTGVTGDAVNDRKDLSSQKSYEEDETATVGKMSKVAPVFAKPKRVKSAEDGQSHQTQQNVSRVSRKRNLEMDDGNSVPADRSDCVEDHTRSRASKKIKSGTQPSAAPESDMVQIDTLIRSLPDDTGILLKPCGKEDSNFKCPKCNKVFRNPKLGSVHYSVCPKNIELSKNKKTLVCPRDVVWLCSLCHSSFNEISKLTQHKKLCILPMSSNASFRSFATGTEYKSASKKCPKCSFECLSQIKFQEHPCKKILKKMQSCSVVMGRLPGLNVASRGILKYFECQQCDKVFFDTQVFWQHLLLHPPTELNKCCKTLNVNNKIKTEFVSLEDDRYADSPSSSNDSTSDVLLNPFNVPRPSSSQSHHPNNASAASTCRQKRRPSNSFLDAFFSMGQIPSMMSDLAPGQTSISTQRDSAKTQTAKLLTRLLSSVEADSNNEASTLEETVCSCRSQPTLPEEDVKPCLKCLNELIHSDMSADSSEEDQLEDARKQEMAGGVQETLDVDEEQDGLEIDEPPSNRDQPSTSNQPSNTVHAEFDLNSEMTLQLMQDINSSPSHDMLTPPSTPDRNNTQSPASVASTSKESPVELADYSNKAGPSGSSDAQSLEDLVSIPLDELFDLRCPSAEFSVRLNEDTQSQAMAAAEPTAPAEPVASEVVAAEPDIETRPALEILPLLAPPPIRHVRLSFDFFAFDAFAVVPSEESEAVDRYICRHCMLPFQHDALMAHLYTETGKPTTEDIIAVYIDESD